MKTLSLVEAASTLKMHPEELRRRAKLGLIPGAKPGKQWVFIESDLHEYLRSLYAVPRQALRGDHGKEKSCHFSSVVVRGGSISPRQAAKELESLLEPKASKKRKSSMTG